VAIHAGLYLLRALRLAVFHLGKHPVVAPALHERTGEHDPSLELFPPVVGQHHLRRHRPVANLLRVPAGGIDVGFHPQLVGADHAGQWIARLHPFPLMRKHLHHHAVERRLDQPAFDRILSRVDLDPLGDRRHRRDFLLQLRLLDLKFALLLVELQAIELDAGHAPGHLAV
jgi:hypothetical protein